MKHRQNTLQALATALCLTLLSAIASAEWELRMTRDSPNVGTALYIKRDGVAFQAFLDAQGSALASEKTSQNHRSDPEETMRDPVVLATHGGIRGLPRALKYADGCREDANHIEAIVECTNAVRVDPDFFARDYPCQYDQWRHEVSNKALKRLSTGSLIQTLAQRHTDDQARMNSMTHTGSDGSDLQTRADRVELPWGTVGENVAVGFSSAKAVVMAWMCSPPHRKNMMSCDFSQIGVGAGSSHSGRFFYTQVFSCDLTETCGCHDDSSSTSHGAPAELFGQETSREETHGAASEPQTRCDWIHGVWTCGEHIRHREHDPYAVPSSRRGHEY